MSDPKDTFDADRYISGEPDERVIRLAKKGFKAAIREAARRGLKTDS